MATRSFSILSSSEALLVLNVVALIVSERVGSWGGCSRVKLPVLAVRVVWRDADDTGRRKLLAAEVLLLLLTAERGADETVDVGEGGGPKEEVVEDGS